MATYTIKQINTDRFLLMGKKGGIINSFTNHADAKKFVMEQLDTNDFTIQWLDYVEKEEPPVNKNLRAEALETAHRLVTKDRNVTHGEPYPNMKVFAKLVSTYINSSQGVSLDLTVVDAAVIMCLFKLHRIAVNPAHLDNCDDLIGYAAILNEAAQIEQGE